MTGPGDPAGDGDGDGLLAGRYRLGPLLGQGGMADVHRAVDGRTGGPVAVKLVRSPDPGSARRLAQEAKALERLRHPGLVQLLDTGVADGRAYLVMELVEGRTLGRVLRDGPVAPGRVAAIGATVAGALAYVHAQGIVHRDVKPGNILVGDDGRARLADFGIASLADASMLTVTGTTLGTAAYMAPEQIEHHQVGPAADVWSLAMVLLECLLGRRVYEGTPAQVVARRLAGPVPVPGDLPDAWRSLLSAMFAHDPQQRPTAAAVAGSVTGGGFHRPWAPAETIPLATLPSDPTVADRTAAAPTVAGPEAGMPPTALGPSTALGPPSLREAGPDRRRTRPAALAAAALGAVAVILLVAWLLGSGAPARSAAGTSGRHAAAPTTTAPATTTTTAPPSPAGASAALLAALGHDVTAGVLPAGQAATIGRDASAAIIDATTGNPAAATSQLDAADGVVASSGSLPAGDAATLQADLGTLAGALGLPAPVPSPTPTTAPPGPGGNGGPGKAPKPGHGH